LESVQITDLKSTGTPLVHLALSRQRWLAQLRVVSEIGSKCYYTAATMPFLIRKIRTPWETTHLDEMSWSLNGTIAAGVAYVSKLPTLNS